MTQRHINGDAVHYLKVSAGKYPLLTAEPEIELGRQVQAMMQILELPEHQRSADWQQIIRKGQKAKEQMIKSNLRLVITMAKKYQNMRLPYEDLIQEGCIGLNRGVEKFDPERGYKASTYLFAWIKQGMTRAIANSGRMIRLPIHMKERTLKLKQLTRELMKENGTKPSAAQLREAMELDEQQWDLLMRSLLDSASYDIPVSKDGNETCLADLLPSSLATPQENLEHIDTREHLEQILSHLKDREAQVLGLRYGVDQVQGRSLAEIGQMLGISRERVRQIESKAMKSARKVANQAQRSA
ncbi:MAG TPA: sigma-70 family RNA polymerase sigma factor [Stenomitos sp.]